MRTHCVVVLPPALDDHLRLGARAEPFEAEAFVAELAIEALYDAILPKPKDDGENTNGESALWNNYKVIFVCFAVWLGY